jgi:hypothetical protein
MADIFIYFDTNLGAYLSFFVQDEDDLQGAG